MDPQPKPSAKPEQPQRTQGGVQSDTQGELHGGEAKPASSDGAAQSSPAAPQAPPAPTAKGSGDGSLPRG